MREWPQKLTKESTHKFWFMNMSKHVNPLCISNHHTYLGNHHTHCKNQTKNNHKPINHLTNQTKPITHRQSKQISTFKHPDLPPPIQTSTSTRLWPKLSTTTTYWCWSVHVGERDRDSSEKRGQNLLNSTIFGKISVNSIRVKVFS